MFVTANSVIAQATPPTDSVPPQVSPPLGTKPPESTPATPDRPVIIPRPTLPDVVQAAGTLAAANMPEFPSDVKELIKAFQAAREDFVKAQKDLAKAMKNSSDEARATLREQMKDNLAKWRDAQSEFRQNLKELIDQMKGNLQSDLRRNVEQGAREGGRK
jgi:gas vesicle protein